MHTVATPAYECIRCFVFVTSANDAVRAVRRAAAQNAGWPDALRLRGESGAKGFVHPTLWRRSHERFDDPAAPPHAGRKCCRPERAGPGRMDGQCARPASRRPRSQAAARLCRVEVAGCADRAQQQHPGNAALRVWHQRHHAVQPAVRAQQPARARRGHPGQPRRVDGVHRRGQKPAQPDPGRAQDAGRGDRGHRVAVLGQRPGLFPQQAQRHALVGRRRGLRGLEWCAAAQRGGGPGRAGRRRGLPDRHRRREAARGGGPAVGAGGALGAREGDGRCAAGLGDEWRAAVAGAWRPAAAGGTRLPGREQHQVRQARGLHQRAVAGPHHVARLPHVSTRQQGQPRPAFGVGDGREVLDQRPLGRQGPPQARPGAGAWRGLWRHARHQGRGGVGRRRQDLAGGQAHRPRPGPLCLAAVCAAPAPGGGHPCAGQPRHRHGRQCAGRAA